MFERILVCLDGSQIDEQIIPYAVEQALSLRSTLVLLRVVTTPTGFVTPGVPGAPGVPIHPEIMLEQAQRDLRQAEAYLDQMAEPLREKGLDVECVALQGQAGPTIVSYAKDNDVGLIAIATHGRKGLGRMVFGSVTDHVLRESGLPILVIKPRQPVVTITS